MHCPWLERHAEGLRQDADAVDLAQLLTMLLHQTLHSCRLVVCRSSLLASLMGKAFKSCGLSDSRVFHILKPLKTKNYSKNVKLCTTSAQHFPLRGKVTGPTASANSVELDGQALNCLY